MHISDASAKACVFDRLGIALEPLAGVVPHDAHSNPTSHHQRLISEPLSCGGAQGSVRVDLRRTAGADAQREGDESSHDCISARVDDSQRSASSTSRVVSITSAEHCASSTGMTHMRRYAPPSAFSGQG